MKKVILLGLIALFGLVNGFTQSNLREVVAVVRPVYDKSTTEFFNDFAKALARDGYYSTAETLRAYAKGGFGTGFVYTNSADGKSYVITNKHVVAQAESINLEFMTSAKDNLKYGDCPVVATHDKLDIAIVALPESFNASNSLSFATQPLTDGTDVFTAGFPGLGSEPSWQLGKGIVSNSDIHVSELTGKDGLGIIQHTAQIDAGSSGGPLLRTNAELPFGYELVGINTWKAIDRENANFAIPVSAIREFVESYLNNSSYSTVEALQQRVADLLKASRTDYEGVLPFISYDYVATLSVTSFYELTTAASKSATEAIAGNFKSGLPIEGVRIGLADAICKSFSGKMPEFSSVQDFSEENKTATVILKQDGKEISSKWIAEQGRWRIAELSSLNTRTLEKGVSTTYGYRNSFRLGIGMPIGGNEIFDKTYNLTIGRTIKTFFTYEFNFSLSSIYQWEDNLDAWIEEKQDFEKNKVKKNIFGLNMGIGGQLPLKAGPIYLIPFAKGWGGFDIAPEVEIGGFNYGFSTGLELGYKLRHNCYLLGGVGYRCKYFASMFDEESKLGKNVSLLEVHIGITY